jgi:hypothetical protein
MMAGLLVKVDCGSDVSRDCEMSTCEKFTDVCETAVATYIAPTREVL